MFLSCWSPPKFWLFYNLHGCVLFPCMGVHIPAVELDDTIQFSILFRMSVLLWHSSKRVCQFSCFLQYLSGTEVLAWSVSMWLQCSNCALPWATEILVSGLGNSNSTLSWPETICWSFWKNAWIFKIPSWVSCGFGFSMLSLYAWLT